MYTTAFLLYLIKAWERTSKKRETEIGKDKLNEMGALNMKLKKWKTLDKNKRASHRPGVLKHDCSLEMHLKL